MIKLFGTLLILLLSACGSNPSPDVIAPINTFTTVTASTQVSTAGMPYFQAYGCNDTTPVCPPIDTPPGQGFVAAQAMIPGQVSKIIAQYLYIGDPNSYSTATSVFKPTQQGLYFIDEQVWFQSIPTQAQTTYYIQLNLTSPYLWYSDTLDTPIGQVVKQKMQINSLLCMNGTTDTASVYASIDSGTDTYILSQESQFEGYYIGPCVSNH